MLKEQLLAEAQNISTAVELDSIFETVQLTPEVKTQFSAVFESVVKQRAVELAESHIHDIAERAEELMEEKIGEKYEELIESTDRYFNHLVESWMKDNKLAIENGIKLQMFESLMGSFKALFEEHNVKVSDEQVDVIAELEEEIQESQRALNDSLKANMELNESIKEMKREKTIEEAVRAANLSDAQRERVLTLSEGVRYNDSFDAKVAAIVEMVSAKPATVTQQDLHEANPNYTPEVQVEVQPETKPEQRSTVLDYLNY